MCVRERERERESKIQTRTHKRAYLCTQACQITHIHARIYLHPHMPTYRLHTNAHTRNTRTQTHTHTHTHTERPHARTHIHTHTNTHTLVCRVFCGIRVVAQKAFSASLVKVTVVLRTGA